MTVLHEPVVAPIAGRIDGALRRRVPRSSNGDCRRQHLEVARRRCRRPMPDRSPRRAGEPDRRWPASSPARAATTARRAADAGTRPSRRAAAGHRRFAGLSIGASVAVTAVGDVIRRGPRRGASSTTRRRQRAATINGDDRDRFRVVHMSERLRCSFTLRRARRRHAPLGGLLEGVGQFDQARLAARGAGEAHAIRRRREREPVRIRRRRWAGPPGSGGIGTNSPNGTITVG